MYIESIDIDQYDPFDVRVGMYNTYMMPSRSTGYATVVVKVPLYQYSSTDDMKDDVLKQVPRLLKECKFFDDSLFEIK